MLNMGQQYTILTLHDQGKTNAEIARQLHCNRHTVENILKRGIKETQVRHKPSAVTPYKEQIQQWFEKDITRQRMYDMLVEEHKVTFSYDALRKFVKKHIAHPKAYGVQEHLAGNEVEVDFGEIVVLLTSENKWVKFQLLAFVLPFSGKKYYELCTNQKRETMITGFQNAFSYFGGVPKKAKVDNLKPAVITNQRHKLEFNQGFLEFAYHYHFIINPCTPYSPEQKGTVEGGVKYAQQNFVPGRTFRTSQDVKEQLHTWTETVNNKVHGTTKEVINVRFTRLEKGLLQPLPENPFSFFHREERTVGNNCHIHFGNNFYSVPFSYVGKTVTIRWNETIIRIIYQGEEIALHTLCSKKGQYVTTRAHLPAHKLYSEEEYRVYHEEKMRHIGNNAHTFFLTLTQAQPGYWRQTLRPIYGFVEKYGREQVEKALGRALMYKALDTRIIKNILEKKLYEIADAVIMPEFTDTGNSRDLTYYES